jgi:broad specificity phosphatase PhoE
MLKALYANGRCVTGVTHAHAFMELSETEQGDCLIGYLDPDSHKFVGDTSCVYLKRLYLVRHAEHEDNRLTRHGLAQGICAGEVIARWDISGFVGFHGPAPRCQKTASVIEAMTGLGFTQEPDLAEPRPGESPESFRGRMVRLMDRLPERAVVVTHCPVVRGLVGVATNGRCGGEPVGPGSVTLIDRCRAELYGHSEV